MVHIDRHVAPSQIGASIAFMVLRDRLREIVIVFISMELIGRLWETF